MLQKKSKKFAYLIASMLLSLISFGGGLFSRTSSSTAYADVPAVNTPSPSNVDSPCPSPCCETCAGDNDK